MSDIRRLEVLDGIQSKTDEYEVTAHWSQIPFADLKKGQIYRMFEPGGEPVDDGEVCVALGDAQLEDGEEENFSVQSLALPGF